MIDQWWTWSGDQLTIAVDKNGDGKPDPETTLVFGGDGGSIAPPEVPGAAPDRSAQGAALPIASHGDGGNG